MPKHWLLCWNTLKAKCSWSILNLPHLRLKHSLYHSQDIYVIDVADVEFEGEDQRIGQIEYEEWIAQGDASFEWHLPQE